MNKNNWISIDTKVSCISFKREYILNGDIKDAYIEITSIGWFHCFVNGIQLDKTAFTPGWTDFTKRVQFNKYKINAIKNNKLSLCVDIAEGWGSSETFMFFFHNGGLSYFPKSLNYHIHIEYSDNKTDDFYSDETVEVFTNEILESSIYNGETQDQFIKRSFLGNAKRVSYDCEIIPQEGEDIVYGERIPAKEIFKDNKGNLIVDFGQNFAGIVEVKLKGFNGEKISYTPCEVLDKDGNFYNLNYRAAKSFYSFTLNEEEKIYSPKFSFLGGRYLKLIDYPKDIKKESFTAVLIHSNLKRTCKFKCGNEKINKLYSNIIYGQLSNYLDVPTDCPQRDERAGWTADAQVFCSTGAINFNINKFFKKWLRDMKLDQNEDGSIEATIPKLRNFVPLVSTGWSDACCVIPYEIYKAYGDISVLEEFTPMMGKWINYLLDHLDENNNVKLQFCFGDWLALDREINDNNYSGLTSFELISTAYLLYDLKLYIYCLNELGLNSNKYLEIFNKIKKSYNNNFICNGHMIGKKALLFTNDDKQTCYSQTGLAMTLAFDLCEESIRESLAKDLNDLLLECGNKMTTGFLGTPCLLFALSKNGYQDTAYNLLLQEEYPSWLYSVNKGATTIWEHYDGIKEDGSFWYESMNSFNHYAYGAVFSWIFNNVAGIKIVKPNYSEIEVKPIFDERIGFVECEYESSYGKIISNWKYEKDHVKVNIVIPKGIKANIILGNENLYVENEINIEKEISKF